VGADASDGAPGKQDPDGGGDGGCNCNLATDGPPGRWPLVALVLFVGLLLVRRRGA
jgi:MYXO-CTERM domain-containing protein